MLLPQKKQGQDLAQQILIELMLSQQGTKPSEILGKSLSRCIN